METGKKKKKQQFIFKDAELGLSFFRSSVAYIKHHIVSGAIYNKVLLFLNLIFMQISIIWIKSSLEDIEKVW